MSYLGSGDPARQRTDHYPAWIDHLADDVTMEGAVLTGVVRGKHDVLTLLGHARTLYDWQDFDFVGPYGADGLVEDYAAQVRGRPIGNIAIVHRNADGQVSHLVMNHRPLPAVLLFNRLMAEHFAGTPYARHFTGEQ